MAYFNVSGLIAAAATKTPLLITATAAVRPRLAAFCWSTDGVPTSDQGVNMALRRHTVAGTSTAVTPSPADPANPAAVTIAGSNASVEPTYTAGNAGFDRAFNPRATVQWAAYDPRAEIVAPATAANGLGFQIIAAGGAAGNVRADMGFYE